MENNNELQMDDTTVDSHETRLSSMEDNFFILLPLFVLSFIFYLQNGLTIPMPLLLATETVLATTTASRMKSIGDYQDISRKFEKGEY